MNKAILLGNVASDPELHTTRSNISQCVFRLAVPRRPKEDGTRETDFMTIVTWRKTAENCARYLSKGRKCCVEGSIQSRTYTAQDGSTRTVTEIVAETVEFINTSGSTEQPPAANIEARRVEPAEPAAYDDGLPF